MMAISHVNKSAKVLSCTCLSLSSYSNPGKQQLELAEHFNSKTFFLILKVMGSNLFGCLFVFFDLLTIKHSVLSLLFRSEVFSSLLEYLCCFNDIILPL